MGSVCAGRVGQRPGRCCAGLQVVGKPGSGMRSPEGAPGAPRRSRPGARPPREGSLQAAWMRWGLSQASEAGPPPRLPPQGAFPGGVRRPCTHCWGELCRPCWRVCGRRAAARRALKARKKPVAGQCARPPPEEERVTLISPLGCDGCRAYSHPAPTPSPGSLPFDDLLKGRV